MMRSGFAAASRSLPPRNSQRMRILLA
ncbi:histidine phosphatase family protein, partial [Xanthomonas oryzae pv. oryzae]